MNVAIAYILVAVVGSAVGQLLLKKGMSTVGALTIAIVAVVPGISGWDVTRLWLHLLSSAMITLIGVQLVIVLIRVLEELIQREMLTKQDMGV